MKNALILILIVATVVLGYFTVRSRLRLSLVGVEGKTGKIVRGDLTLPINATGEVLPSRRVEVKSEASGEVIEIVRLAGDRVKANDLLIRLQREDEERSVNRARLDLNVAEARLENARIILEQAKTVDRATAQSRVDQLEASVDFARFQKTKFENLPAGQATEEERLQRATTLRSQEAQLAGAKADLDKVGLVVARAEQDLRQFQAGHETAKNNLADAEKRLSDTNILAPIDGIVGDMRVQVGEVIQGGKTTFTGGTVLAYVLDVDTLIVRAEVDEADIGRVLAISPQWARPGNDGSLPMPKDVQAAVAASGPLPTLTVESFRDLKLEGVIQRVYPEPVVRQNVTTYSVDVVIVSEDHSMLLPRMRADVNFTSEQVKNALLCPNEAIRSGPSGGQGVFIPKPDAPQEDRATEFIPCQFGLDNGNYSEVKCDALKESMIVYTQLPAKKDDGKEKEKRR